MAQTRHRPTSTHRPAPVSAAQAIATDLRTRFGLNNLGVAAFLGNFSVESGFSSTAWNPGEQARGWAQWEGGRRTHLQSIAARMGLAETDPRAQMALLNSELSGAYSGVLYHLRGATNIDEAAQIVQSQFEGSTPDSLPQRQAAAASMLSKLNSGSPLTAGPSVLSGGASGLTGGTGGGLKPTQHIGGALNVPWWSRALQDAGAVGQDISNLNPVEWVPALLGAAGKYLLIALAVLVGVILIVVGLKAGADADKPPSSSSRPKVVPV